MSSKTIVVNGIVEIDEIEFYDAIEMALEAGAYNFEAAHDEIYRWYKQEYPGLELNLPLNPKREMEIQEWLDECGQEDEWKGWK